MLIITDGIKHDEIQDYNVVVRIYKNGDYKAETKSTVTKCTAMTEYL